MRKRGEQTMKLIIHHAPDETMGDTSPRDCAYYRVWARDEIVSAYPGFKVIVTWEPGDDFVNTGHPGLEGGEEIRDFLDHLWDRCEWEWVEG